MSLKLVIMFCICRHALTDYVLWWAFNKNEILHITFY